MGMIQTISSQISSKKQLPVGIENDDLISWGIEGLIKAYRNFKANKGSKFATYAYYRIRGEIFDRIREEWQYRNPTTYHEQRKQIQEKIADLLETSFETGTVLTPSMIEEHVQRIVADTSVSYLISLDMLEDNDQNHSPAKQTDNSKTQVLEDSLLWDEIKQLEPEEEKIIKMFYIEGKKQKDIAEELNYSNSKICRIHTKILEKLRKKLKHRLEEESE